MKEFTKKQIRLGYPEILRIDSNQVPIAWFFGQRGQESNLDYQCFADECYRDLKEGNKTSLTNWYVSDRVKFTSLEFTWADSYPTYQFVCDTYTAFMERGVSFLVPILVTTSYPDTDLKYLLSAKLPEDLLNYIHTGKASVLFFSHSEGNITSRWFDYFEKFCKNNGLSKGEAFLSVSALNEEDFPKYADDQVVAYRTINYFGQDLWWKSGNKFTSFGENSQDIFRFLKQNRTIPKEKTFLCLNRRIMPHRFFIAGFFLSNPEILDKTWLSLGTSNVNGFNENNLLKGKDALDYARGLLENPNNHVVQGIRKYYQEHAEDCILRQLDLEDLNMTKNPIWINEDLYRTSFVNVITETYADNRHYQFLTEKTTKTLYSMMPFILVSTEGTLEKLRRLGFKTFDRYWSEEYDLIPDERRRFLEICRVIREISSWSSQKLFEVTQDMESILYHNARLLINPVDLDETLDWLCNIQNRLNENRIYRTWKTWV